ncbi:MAG: glycosyltransferase family 39 protein, partial [Anaerolineae bacterium]|nr:glycosyltransferase family 39 protein [Anaerolineae bacterium]
GLRLGGQLFPVMTQDYIGAINTYSVLPFIAWLGPTPAAVRLPSILGGGLTLLLAYALTARLTGQRRAGLAAALLLAVDPTFVFWTRQGIFVTAITAPLGLAAALCWLRRGQGGGPGWSVAGAFCLGVGLYAKLLFIWLIAAMAGALILVNLGQGRKVWGDLKRKKPKVNFGLPVNWPSKREIGFSMLAFLLGCWPLLFYNLQTGGTWRSIIENAGTSFYGVDNAALGANLLARIGQFGSLLTGSHLWYLGQIYANPLPGLALAVILLGVGGVMIRRAAPLDRLSQATLFPFVVIALVIVASIQTVSALWVTHFALLLPWPAIALATGGGFLGQLSTRSIFRWGMGLGLALLLLTNLTTTVRYHLSLTESGGLSTHSDAIYDLSDWLAAQTTAETPVVAMDWGLAAPIFYLTGGQVAPVEVFGYVWQPDDNLTGRLARFVDQPATLYLWRAPDEIIFDRSDEFKALYRPLALEETIEAAFYERSGRPILGITRLVTCGTPGIQSPEPAPHCP